jgi:hypothetical protein
MIHIRATRALDSSNLDGLHISITSESIPDFKAMVDRALNCWDRAPPDLKQLGDLLTHGRVTQDYNSQT